MKLSIYPVASKVKTAAVISFAVLAITACGGSNGDNDANVNPAGDTRAVWDQSNWSEKNWQ